MLRFIRFLKFQVNLRVISESEEESHASRVGQLAEYSILNVANLTRTITSSDLKEVINPLSVPEDCQPIVSNIHGILWWRVSKHALKAKALVKALQCFIAHLKELLTLLTIIVHDVRAGNICGLVHRVCKVHCIAIDGASQRKSVELTCLESAMLDHVIIHGFRADTW